MNGRSAGEAAGLRRRRGFSLLEVILATAMLMGSAIVLSRLAGMGREQSQAARTQDALQSVCEKTFNELLLGLRPLIPAEDQPLLPLEPLSGQPVEPIVETPVGRFAVPVAQTTAAMQESAGSALDASSGASPAPSPEWRFSIRTQPQAAFPGMWILTVEVAQGDQQLPRRKRFALTRWISGPPPSGAFADPRWQQSFDSQMPVGNGFSLEGGLQ